MQYHCETKREAEWHKTTKDHIDSVEWSTRITEALVHDRRGQVMPADQSAYDLWAYIAMTHSAQRVFMRYLGAVKITAKPME